MEDTRNDYKFQMGHILKSVNFEDEEQWVKVDKTKSELCPAWDLILTA